MFQIQAGQFQGPGLVLMYQPMPQRPSQACCLSFFGSCLSFFGSSPPVRRGAHPKHVCWVWFLAVAHGWFQSMSPIVAGFSDAPLPQRVVWAAIFVGTRVERLSSLPSSDSAVSTPHSAIGVKRGWSYPTPHSKRARGTPSATPRPPLNTPFAECVPDPTARLLWQISVL